MKKIVFICTGNTCRSPMAEAYMNSFCLTDIKALSRGLYADGSPVSENSVKAMKNLGLSVKSNSEQLRQDDTYSDLFVCMSSSHAELIKSVGIDDNKIIVLGGGIPDPFGGNLDAYIACRNSIVDGVNKLVFDGTITSYSVVKATEDDSVYIAELEKQCFAEPWSKQGIIDSMNASTLFFVAKQDGKVVGYIGVSIVADEGYITNVAVFEEHRQKGIATILLNRVICEARAQSLAFVSLEVRASNEKAIRIYQKLGFKTEGVRKNFYRLPTEDAKIMTRRF